MGMDFNTIIAYGIDLGGESKGWKVREADEDGTWEPEWHDEGSLIWCAERRLLRHAEYDPDNDVLEKKCGLEFVSYRAPKSLSWMLVTWHKTIYPGDIYDVSWPWLNHERIAKEWDAGLIEAMEVLGANSVDGPGWLVTSYVD